MAAEKEEKPVDPFDAFRGMRDSYLDAVSKVMINAVNSEEYAQATGAMLNSSLMASAPFREAFDKAMAAALQKIIHAIATGSGGVGRAVHQHRDATG